MAVSSTSRQPVPSTTRPLQGAAAKWQERMVARLPEALARLIRLQERLTMSTWSSARKHVSSELDKLRNVTTSNSPSDTPIRDGLFFQEEARLVRQLAALDAQEAGVLERDAVEVTRPEGCLCLGAGGIGRLICVLSDGLPIFEDYCGCEDGERVREAAAWASEAILAADVAVQQQQRAQQQQQRTRELLERAGIERRYEVCTFDNFRALLQRRGLMTAALRVEIDAREQAYAHGEPLRGDYIWGAAGHGKTSKAISALRAWIERGRMGRFISEGDFLDRLHASMSQKDGDGDSLLELLKTYAGLLVYDDLAMSQRTPYDRGKITSLIVARHGANLLTIFTSNYHINEAARRLSGEDGLEHGRLEGRLREMCDEWQLVTGQLRTPHREDVPAAR